MFLLTVFDFESISQISVAITISDGDFAVSENLTIIITDVNEAPNISNLPCNLSLPENTSIGAFFFNVTVSDPEDDSITFDLTSNPIFTITDGMFTPTPMSGIPKITFSQEEKKGRNDMYNNANLIKAENWHF